jgi:hypothetical protein
MSQLNISAIEKYCEGTEGVPEYLQPLIALRTGVNTQVPITDQTGRTRDERRLFDEGIKYEDYAMRRKAEVLKYSKNSSSDSNSVTFSRLQNRRKIKNLDTLNSCPVRLYPPSNSGVTDLVFPGYFFNKSVPYQSSI